MTVTLLGRLAGTAQWRWLAAHGWHIVASTDPRVRGTAATDRATRRILVRFDAFDHPGTRHIRYVIPHEMWHAVHAEALHYDCAALMAARKLDYRSALEVVADAACLDGTWRMTLWVRASVAWHGRHNYSYRWADLRSPEARALVARLRAVIAVR